MLAKPQKGAEKDRGGSPEPMSSQLDSFPPKNNNSSYCYRVFGYSRRGGRRHQAPPNYRCRAWIVIG